MPLCGSVAGLPRHTAQPGGEVTAFWALSGRPEGRLSSAQHAQGSALRGAVPEAVGSPHTAPHLPAGAGTLTVPVTAAAGARGSPSAVRRSGDRAAGTGLGETRLRAPRRIKARSRRHVAPPSARPPPLVGRGRRAKPETAPRRRARPREATPAPDTRRSAGRAPGDPPRMLIRPNAQAAAPDHNASARGLAEVTSSCQDALGAGPRIATANRSRPRRAVTSPDPRRRGRGLGSLRLQLTPAPRGIVIEPRRVVTPSGPDSAGGGERRASGASAGLELRGEGGEKG